MLIMLLRGRGTERGEEVVAGRALIFAAAGLVCAAPAFAADAPAKDEPGILVIGERKGSAPEKLDHILPEVDGTKITVTKKTTVTKLDLVPTIVDNNQREL